MLTSTVFSDQYDDAYIKMTHETDIQKIYLNGVPHFDKQGDLLLKYNPERSFFTVGLWGAPNGEVYGINYDWQVFKDMGFNTIWPWKTTPTDLSLELGKKYDLQIILQNELSSEEAKRINGNSNLLAVTYIDEPTNYWDSRDEILNSYENYIKLIRENGPNIKVFINNNSWITNPATSYWGKFDALGDFSCHDNYPIKNNLGRCRTLGDQTILGSFFNGIPQSVSLARIINDEKRPVLFIIDAFEQPTEYGRQYSCRFPTVHQIRTQAYAAIIHGATGLACFAWDSYILREGGCIGMSNNPKADISDGKYMLAKPYQLIESKLNYEAVKQLNLELAELTPVILSNTADVDYSLSLKGTSISKYPVRCILKNNPKGGYVLISSNIDDAWLSVEFSFEKDIKTAMPMFEDNKPLKLEDNKFTISFEPFETHIIKIN